MASAEILAIIEQAAESWTELDLSKKRLTEIPEEIAQLFDLTGLDFGYDQTTKLPR